MLLYRKPFCATRSMVGVGMTPPNVLGTPKPASSVMINKMLGASLGGTIRGGHHIFDCKASFLITPPHFGSGGGSCFPADRCCRARRTWSAGGLDFCVEGTSSR